MLHSLFTRSYELETDEEDEIIEEGVERYPSSDADGNEQFYLIDEEDRDILMHRDAHFGGSFDLMLEAYRDGEKSAVVDTSCRRIEALQKQEVGLQNNLAALLLTGRDAEKVAMSRKMYRDLGSLFDEETEEKTLQKAIASLILSEAEDPVDEIAHVAEFGQEAIQPLIELMQSELFQDPLFPGYGLAPSYAARALGELKSEKAIEPLIQFFENNPDAEEAAIQALISIGKPAQELLMRKAAHGNEEALIALLAFANADCALFCFDELKKHTHSPIAHLLALGCELLPEEKRKEFAALEQDPRFSKETKEEIHFLVTIWNKHL